MAYTYDMAVSGLTQLGKLKLSYVTSLNKPLVWFKMVTPSTESIVALFNFHWFWS